MRVKKLIKRTPVEYFGTIVDVQKKHKYIATNGNGDVYSYERKPSLATNGFIEIDGISEFIGEANIKGDEWKASLRKVR